MSDAVFLTRFINRMLSCRQNIDVVYELFIIILVACTFIEYNVKRIVVLICVFNKVYDLFTHCKSCTSVFNQHTLYASIGYAYIKGGNIFL